MENLTSVQMIIALIGTVGLVSALLFVLKKRPAKRKISLGIEANKSGTETIAIAAAQPRNRWWDALEKSRTRFLVRSGGDVQTLRDSLEEACLGSDLGVANTQEALDTLAWPELAGLPESERLGAAKQRLANLFSAWIAPSGSSDLAPQDSKAWPVKRSATEPTVIWFVGVNGTGKTTSIAKLASELKARGHSVLLGAGDTFRAAAGEQLESWGNRLGISVIKGQEGADASSVLFDAIQAGIARKVDFVLCDSAGRLHNQNQLMDALAKNKRVMDKALPGAPHEVILVLDANTGQNMLSQAEHFGSAVGITGLVLTKLDGTARGGAVVAVARKTSLPIRRLGLGEQADDFVAFESDRFASALLGME